MPETQRSASRPSRNPRSQRTMAHIQKHNIIESHMRLLLETRNTGVHNVARAASAGRVPNPVAS